MSRVLSTSVQVMGEATPREMKSKLGIRLKTRNMAEIGDRSRPSRFLFDGMEFRGWLAPFGAGFGLSLVDGDLPAEMGADHISSRLREEGVEVEGVFDMKDASDRNRFQRWATDKLVGSSTRPTPTPSPRNPGLKERLEAIQAQMPNDRFIKSLQDNLKRRGRLTQNQINAISKIETQLAGPKDQALIDRINALLAKKPEGDSFLESLKDQVANGRPLSKKQLKALADNENKPRTRKTRRTRQDGGQYTNLSQFHTWNIHHQLNALAGGHVARALYGIPESNSREERSHILLAEVASASHSQMGILTRIKAVRQILPHLPKHPLLKDLPAQVSEMVLTKVIVDGQAWRDDLSQF